VARVAVARGTGTRVTESQFGLDLGVHICVPGNSGEFRLGGADRGGNGQNPTNPADRHPLFDEIGTKMHTKKNGSLAGSCVKMTQKSCVLAPNWGQNTGF
jgi:hypothetical protein